MLDDVKRFDMERPPMRMHLRPLMWLLITPTLISHRNKLVKTGMEGIKPPYLLLCNHNSFMDFSVALKAVMPHRANFVVAIDGFLKREWLLRFIGCICKRKFTRDISVVRHLKKVVENGDIPVIYPEARYSLCGTDAVLPASLGKLAKNLGVPVVTLICHGHHVNSPFYNLPDHKVKGTRAEMKLLFTREQLKEAGPEEIQRAIEKEFEYDDFAWQLDNRIRIDYPRRAEGLHKVLYQCPHCMREYRMGSSGTELSCGACGRKWTMDEYGQLSAEDGVTEFENIPDWYEWERANVRGEIEAGTYGGEWRVKVYSLPNSSGYIDMGEAVLRHDMEGFSLSGSYKGSVFSVNIPARSQYSVHIEYEYLGKYGDCVDLNTLKDTLYSYPQGNDFSVTKMALATEELYKYYALARQRQKNASVAAAADAD